MTLQARVAGWTAGCDRTTAAWLAVAALLTLLTLASFLLWRYETVAFAWPVDPEFATVADGSAVPRAAGASPTGGWEVEGEPGRVAAGHGTLRLRNDDPEGGVGVRQVWRLEPGAPHVFRLSATVGGTGLVGHRRGFRVGEVTLVADKAIDRRRFNASHRLIGVRGTQAPARFVEYFTFPADTRQVELAVRLRHVTGELTVGGVEVAALGDRPWFSHLRTALQVAWLGTLAVGCWLFGRGIDHRPSGIVLALATGSGFALLMMPEGLRNGSLDGLAGVVPAALGGADALAGLGHFAIFAVAGLLLRLSRRGDPWPPQLLLLLALAGLSEVLQYLAEMRSPELDDWAVNAVGALGGWLAAMAWLWWRQEGQFATHRRSSTTLPPQAAKQRL